MTIKLVRFYVPGQGARLGQWIDDAVYDVTASGAPYLASLTALLQASCETGLSELLAGIEGAPALYSNDLVPLVDLLDFTLVPTQCVEGLGIDPGFAITPNAPLQGSVVLGPPASVAPPNTLHDLEAEFGKEVVMALEPLDRFF